MDWELNYGRVGFGAGFAGAARPFGAENKPVLNLNIPNFNHLVQYGQIPPYYNNGQILLWEDDYSKPLPQNRQPFIASQKKVAKRNYVKQHNDLTDTVTERKPPTFDYVARKERRDARLVSNPFQNTVGPNTPLLSNRDATRKNFARKVQADFLHGDWN